MSRLMKSTSEISNASKSLIDWYRKVRRDLPWRRDRDPYRIWISEVMLQQTTVVAVIPYYERFLKTFPDLTSLAKASIEDVMEHWAGLGYYSRARNLHKAARILEASGFPRSHNELMSLPGFGPYTSRAVASLAFNERTGVLDGNVIRVLSRRFGLAVEWWKPRERDRLQKLADELADVRSSSDLNQGLMELGATVCTPQSPACLLCPWTRSCVARKANQIHQLPLKKPRRAKEVWVWRPQVIQKGGSVLLVLNEYAPFLKGHWILPGSTERVDAAPKLYDYRGSVTHYDIFVSVTTSTKAPARLNKKKWVKPSLLVKEIPSSLVRKAIHRVHGTALEP